MTDETRETPKQTRRTRRGGLWVNDAELIEKLNVPEKIAYAAIHLLDHNKLSGFPPKQELWGWKRYWPAVKDYFDYVYGIKLGGAARVAPERPDRDGLPRRSHLAVPLRRATHD